MTTHGRDRRSTLRRRLLLTSFSIFIVLSGCHNPDTIWSTEVRSPDGQWLALAHRDQFGGPGNAGLFTSISLKRTTGDTRPMQVLLFDENQGPTDLKMNWLTSTHLEVTYTQSATIDFQAIKCGGIDISLRDLSDGPRHDQAHKR